MRRIVGRAGLDERQVDLHDVELHLAQEPETGVPGPDIIGGEPQAGGSQRLHVATKLVKVLDLLAFRQLQHDPVERDRVPSEDAFHVARPEERRPERSR